MSRYVVNERQGAAFNERARLKELLSLRVLDTQPEERFDRYTRLVADVFHVPMALISLLDDQRQWFKSRVGVSACETGRDVAFCDHALVCDLLEVPDTWTDSRFADNPMVTGDPYIRFYAGAVLRGPTGMPLGTLAILDREPRRLTPGQRRQLQAFAGLVEQELLFNVELSRTRSELARTVLRDPLTMLVGPLLIEERADEWIARLEPPGESLTGVQLCVTNLHDVNRVYGAECGDALLRALVERVQACLPDSAELARLGGARFLALVPTRSGVDDATEVVTRLARCVGGGVRIAGSVVHPVIALGVAVAPDDADTGATLIERTGHALRDSEKHPAAPVHVYSARTASSVARRKRLAFRLVEALNEGRLSLAFQSIVGLNSNRTHSVEALARWRDAELGEVEPSEFVPQVGGDGDLSRALLGFMLESACTSALTWPLAGLNVAVNVTGIDVHRPDFVDFVLAALERFGFPPQRLTLELTEETLVTDRSGAAGKILALREHGVGVAIDDFGTGYSSLSYLRYLPVSGLKIDRSFVTEVATDASARRLVDGVVDIARALELTVVAEGIETAEQMQCLREIGCDFGQGYFVGCPLAPAAIAARLRDEAEGAPAVPW